MIEKAKELFGEPNSVWAWRLSSCPSSQVPIMEVQYIGPCNLGHMILSLQNISTNETFWLNCTNCAVLKWQCLEVSVDFFSHIFFIEVQLIGSWFLCCTCIKWLKNYKYQVTIKEYRDVKAKGKARSSSRKHSSI